VSDETKEYMDCEGFCCLQGQNEKDTEFCIFVKENSPYVKKNVDRDWAECLIYHSDDEDERKLFEDSSYTTVSDSD
jgi:hypothetical protein